MTNTIPVNAIPLQLHPGDREQWLRTPEAIAALGAAQCAKLLKSVRRQRGKIGSVVPSAPWLDAWEAGEPFPAFAMEPEQTIRLHASRMILSRAAIRIGTAGVRHRRWTPPNAVACEDALDCMTEAEAERYSHPPSPSAVAIRVITAVGKKDAMYALMRGLVNWERYADTRLD